MRNVLTKEQIKAIADRAEGKEPDPIEINDGRPVTLEDRLGGFIKMLRDNREMYKEDENASLAAYKVIALGEQILQKFGSKQKPE